MGSALDVEHRSPDYDSDTSRLVAHIVAELGDDWHSWPEWPGGWPDEIEAALIDAVYSVRASYGGRQTGVRAVVQRWRTYRAPHPLNDLAALAATDHDTAADVLANAQVLPGGSPKSAAIVEAARNLVDAGVRHASDLTAEHRSAYTRVRGLGEQTWNYLLILLSRPGIKADIWITRFVSTAVGRTVGASEAHTLMLQAAQRLGCSPTRLDHTVWLHMRNGGLAA